MTWREAAFDLIAWLDAATLPSGAVRERYKISAQSWGSAVRPDCNAETVYALLRAWTVTGNASYLTRSRATWEAFMGMQMDSGAWPMADWTDTRWANDNSEVAIFLLRAADLDPVNRATYRTAALRTTDYLASVQDATTHLWHAGLSGFAYLAAWCTAHAVAALATAYPLASTTQQAAYLTAIESGIAAISTRILTGERIQTAYETHGAEEAWRPPSSEQSICVRGIALAEKHCGQDSTQAATWTTIRHRLLTWLDPLIDTSGAIRNGYGVGVTHADVAHITDHVYTTAFAIEAYRLSAALDHNPAYRVIADGIADFTAGNLYYSATDPDANGCLRGAYDLTAQDWNTSEVAQNGGEEGGGDMAYTGWSAAPVAALLLEDARRRRPGLAVI